jgi:hypothetical protein
MPFFGASALNTQGRTKSPTGMSQSLALTGAYDGKKLDLVLKKLGSDPKLQNWGGGAFSQAK